jgi:hypothetical protein
LKAELGQANPKLPLLSLCDEYYRGLREILLAYLMLNGSDIERAVHYEDAVVAAGKVPIGATPIIFHGTPEAAHAEAKSLGQDKPEWTTGLSFFPFDELKLVKILIAEAMSGGPAA